MRAVLVIAGWLTGDPLQAGHVGLFGGKANSPRGRLLPRISRHRRHRRHDLDLALGPDPRSYEAKEFIHWQKVKRAASRGLADAVSYADLPQAYAPL